MRMEPVAGLFSAREMMSLARLLSSITCSDQKTADIGTLTGI
jgi:hypothetical protein